MSEKPRRLGAQRRVALRRTIRPHRPHRLRSAAAVGGLALAMSIAACSSEPQLSASVDTMVELESSLQCDITRFAHPDAAAVEGYRDQVRERFSVSTEDHTIFLDMLAADEELRGRVADRADVLCPPAVDDDDLEES